MGFTRNRDAKASLPDEFTVFAGLVRAPDGAGEKLAALVLCHCGALAGCEARSRRTSGPAGRRSTRSGPRQRMNWST